MINNHQSINANANANISADVSELRILMTAKHPFVTEGMKCVIESMISPQKFMTSLSLMEAKNSVQSNLPNVVIVDAIFGKGDVIDFITWTKDTNAEIKILLLTDSLEDELCVYAFKAGARGCFLKSASPDKILHSLLTVQEGRILLDEGFVKTLLSLNEVKNEPPKDLLKPRDIDILSLVAQGNTNQDISNRIFLSSRTVQGHLSKIFSKLGVKTRTEAVSKAIQLGILHQEQDTHLSLPH